jgi:hypothetical protein
MLKCWKIKTVQLAAGFKRDVVARHSAGDESGGDSENVARRQRRDGGTRENVATAAAIMTALQRWQRA